MADVVIDPRFRGPPRCANGGYACAMAAEFVEGPAEVTLRAPPPLERPLSVTRGGEGAVRLFDEGTLVAEAYPASVDEVIPQPSRAD